MVEIQSAIVPTTLYKEKHIQEEPNVQAGVVKARPGVVAPEQPTPNLLIVSPYTTIPHLLDLDTLDIPNRLMALALRTLAPTTPHYATLPYSTSFNWPLILSSLRQLCLTHSHIWTSTSFYCVVFTSQLRPSCHYPDLSALDQLSHAEAMASGGFLKYWFGAPDGERRNLATCVWRSMADARKGSGGWNHRIAAQAAGPSYEWFAIQRLRFVVGDGGEEWRFETWDN